MEKLSSSIGAYYCPRFGRLLATILAKHGLQLDQAASRLLSCGTPGAAKLLIEVKKSSMVKVAQLADGKERPALTFWLDQAGYWYPIECNIDGVGRWRYCRVKANQELLVSVKKLDQQKDAAHHAEVIWLPELAKLKFKAGRSAA